jgi:RES domain-containing protein
VAFDQALVTRLELANLPPDWKSEPAPGSTRRLGDLWVAKAASVVLGVPSTVIPQELNFLLNSAHSSFIELRTLPPQRFDFDPRLKAE